MTRPFLKLLILCLFPGWAFVTTSQDKTPLAPSPADNENSELKSGVTALEAQQDALTKKKTTLFQAALFDPVQIFSKKYSVNGMRFNLFYSENLAVNGLDIAAAGLSSSRFMNGLQTGLAVNSKECNGLQISAFAEAPKKFNGMQITALDIPMNETDTFNGLRIDCIGMPCEIKQMNGFLVTGIMSLCQELNGFQFAYVAVNKETNGMQVSATFNQSDKINGFQIGIFNYSDELTGVQIGLLNFAPKNWLPFSIGLNLGF
ncbi:MAG: hypothetical protein QXH80_03500 [Candidatus Nanoarchaeia archaeon]